MVVLWTKNNWNATNHWQKTQKLIIILGRFQKWVQQVTQWIFIQCQKAQQIKEASFLCASNQSLTNPTSFNEGQHIQQSWKGLRQLHVNWLLTLNHLHKKFMNWTRMPASHRASTHIMCSKNSSSVPYQPLKEFRTYNNKTTAFKVTE